MLNAITRAGDLDRFFGDNGTAVLEGDQVQAIAVLKNPGPQQGKIVGILRDGNDFKLFRLLENGRIDTSFANNGYLLWAFAGNSATSIPTGITELSDDKLLVTGYIRESGLPPLHYAAVARFNPGGSIDLMFAQNGVFIFRQPLPGNPPPSDSHLVEANVYTDFAVTSQADGSILLAFNSSALSPYRDHAVLIQLTAAGLLDVRFNQQGFLFFQIEMQSTASVALVIRENGNILVAGNSGDQGFLAEFDDTGILNRSFGTDGVSLFNITGGTLKFSALLLQADDKPVVVGSFTTGGTSVKGYVNRTLPDGGGDTSFNSCNALVVERPFFSLRLSCAVLDSEQAIVIAGELTARALGLAGRVTPDGSMDPAFGKDGLTDTTEEGILTSTYSVAIQSARQIVLAGKQMNSSAVTRHHG
jgi:uncharacterized delta-60 repeat protein